jgi:hypothetical protein
MSIWEALDKVDKLASEHDWEGLQQFSRTFCAEQAGNDSAEHIARLDVDRYVRELRKAARSAASRAQAAGAPAVYFEYDVDNGWKGTFFICRSYAAKEAGDDDWATDWQEFIVAPGMAAFAAARTSFDSTDADIGKTVILAARTLACVWEATDWWRPGLVLCAGFHDQSSVTRLHA